MTLRDKNFFRRFLGILLLIISVINLSAVPDGGVNSSNDPIPAVLKKNRAITGNFGDTGNGFLIQDIGSGKIRVNEINLISGTANPQQILTVGGNGSNAYGFNPSDNYIYGIQRLAQDNGTNKYNLMKIGRSTTNNFDFSLGKITGIVDDDVSGMFIGDFDKNGDFYVAGETNIYKVRINGDGTATAVNAGLIGSPRFADWGYTDRIGGEERFYFVSNDQLGYFKKSSNGTLTRVNSVAKVGNDWGTVIAVFIANTEMYVYPSSKETLYKVDLSDPTKVTSFSNVASSSSGDGARKYTIPVTNLLVQKSVDKPEAKIGDILTYTLTVTNTSTGFDLTNIVVKDILAQDVTKAFEYFDVYRADGTKIGGAIGTPTLPTQIVGDQTTVTIETIKLLKNGQSVTYKIKGKIKDTVIGTTILNAVSGKADQTSLNTSDNVITTLLQANYKAIKNVKQSETGNIWGQTAVRDMGGNITYQIKIENTGNIPLTGYTFIDTPDSKKIDINSLSGVAITMNGVAVAGSFSLETTGPNANSFVFKNGIDIPVGQTLIVQYTLKSLVFDILNNGNTIINTLNANVAGLPSQTSSTTVTVNENVNASIEKTAIIPTVDMNGIAKYSLVVKNTGNQPLSGYTLKDTPDLSKVDIASLNVTSILANGAAATGVKFEANASGEIVLSGAPTIDVGKTLEILYELTVKTFDISQGNVITNTGSLVVKAGDPEKKSEAKVTVNGKSDAEIKKTAITPTVNQNGIAKYKLEITNTGNQPLSGYTLKDTPDLSKVDIGSLNVTSILANGATATGVKFEANALGEIELIGDPTIPTLGVGSKLEILYEMAVKTFDVSQGNVITNTGSLVVKPGAPEKKSEAKVTVNENVNASIKKTAITPTVDMNGIAKYSLVITNSGNQALSGYILKDTPDLSKVDIGSLNVTSILVNGGAAVGATFTANASGEIVLSGAPTIDVGKTLEILYELTVKTFDISQGNVITNTGSLVVKAGDPEKKSEAKVTVNGKSDAEIKKTAITPTVNQNGIAKYKLVITNTGNQPLSGYTLKDTPDLLKVDIASLNVTSILVNGGAAVGATFTANALGEIVLSGAPTIEVGNKLEILYELTAKDFDISQDNKITNIASLIVKPGAPEQKSQADVLVAVATVTKTSPQAGKIVQPGDKVEYIITLTNSTNTEFKEFVLYDGLLADNSFLTLNDITKVPTIVGNSLFASGGVKVDVQANSTMEIKYELTIPSIPTNIALPVEITNVVLDQKVVVTVDKPKLTLRHDVFKYDSKYEDVNELIAIEKPIVDNFESIEGKNTAPPIVYPGEDVLYYISLINTGKVEAKGRIDIGHEVNSIPKDDNGKQALLKNEFKGVVFTNLDDGSKKHITQEQLSDKLGLTIEETLFYFSEKVAPRSAVSFVVKSKVNPEGQFSKKPELELYAYLPADSSQNDKKGELRRTVIQIARRNTDLILNKKADIEEASIGKFVPYTLQIKNVGLDDAVDVFILDKIPPGFIYVDGSAVLVLDDGIQQTKVPTTGVKEIVFGPIPRIKSGDTIEIKYLLKVGVGVKPGTYKNSAVTQDNKSNPTSNYDSVDIEIVSDPIFEHTTIIGKVFHDRDGDGIQDYADAKNLIIEVKMPKDVYIPNTTTISKNGGKYFFSDSYKKITVRELKGRKSELEPATNNMVVIRKQINTASMATVRVQSNQGTDIIQQNDGKVITRYTGDKAKGLTSQDVVITQRVIKDSSGKMFLEIFILNNGIQEEGLPGVRLATPEGIVVETDRYGRYHVPPVAETIGRNYIIKVDPTTLPKGSEFTTENPKVRQVGKVMMKFNFGVKLPELKK